MANRTSGGSSSSEEYFTAGSGSDNELDSDQVADSSECQGGEETQARDTKAEPSGESESVGSNKIRTTRRKDEVEEEDGQSTPQRSIQAENDPIPMSPVVNKNASQKVDYESPMALSPVPFHMANRTSGGSSSSEQCYTAESGSDTETDSSGCRGGEETQARNAKAEPSGESESVGSNKIKTTRKKDVEPSTFFARGELKFDGHGNFQAKFRPEQNPDHEFDDIPKNRLVTLFHNKEFKIGNKIEFRMTCKCEDDPPKAFHFGDKTSVFTVEAPFRRAGETITRVLEPPPFPRPRLIVECCVWRDGVVITDSGKFRIAWPDNEESKSSGTDQSVQFLVQNPNVQGDCHVGGSSSAVDRSQRETPCVCL